MQKLVAFFYKLSVFILVKLKIDKLKIVNILKEKYIKIFKKESVIILGHKMFLDKNDSLRLSINKVYEPFETEFFKNEIKKGDIVIDIGANIGYYTLLFAKLVGENGQVYAFEPDPVNFSILEKNIKINKYKNVILEQKAVFKKTEKLKLYLNDKNKSDHRIYQTSDNQIVVDISAVSLDDYFKEKNKKIDLIKIDIQGAEINALEGMKNILLLNKNIKFITEYYPIAIEKFGESPCEYLNTLTNLNFRKFNINEEKKVIEEITSDELEIKINSQNFGCTNLFCKR